MPARSGFVWAGMRRETMSCTRFHSLCFAALWLAACSSGSEPSKGSTEGTASGTPPASSPAVASSEPGVLAGSLPVPLGEERETSATTDHARASAEVYAVPGENQPAFDYRVLAREGQPGLSFKATWQGSVALIQSRFGWMKVALAFDLTDEKVLEDFVPRSDGFKPLDDCLKDVFRMRRSNELQGAEAIENLREDIIAAVNKLLGSTVVRQVYFTDYSLGFR